MCILYIHLYIFLNIIVKISNPSIRELHKDNNGHKAIFRFLLKEEIVNCNNLNIITGDFVDKAFSEVIINLNYASRGQMPSADTAAHYCGGKIQFI